MTRKRLWAWLVHPPLVNRTTRGEKSARHADITSCANADERLSVWLFDAEPENHDKTSPNISETLRGMCASISHDSAGVAQLTIRIRNGAVGDGTVGEEHGLLLYEGPMEATDADLLAFWSKLIADRLTDDEKP